MADKRVNVRQVVLLALLLAAAVVLGVMMWPRAAAEVREQATRRDPIAAGQADPAVPPALGLETIEGEKPAPANTRDLFRFGAARPESTEVPGGEPIPAQPGGRRGVPVQEPPAQQPGPPQPVAMPLRYVGFAETPGSGKTAAISDGRFTYYGREGDVIEGRWRIIQITAQTLVIEHVDGSGRQTLRLSGEEAI